MWAIYSSYQIYYATDDGKIIRQLTAGPGYNAEATLSTDGKKVVFTSSRDGDLDIYSMNVDGTEVRRLTNTLGYDGGPFFSSDGKWIVYRAHHPTSDQEIAHYKSLLAQGLVEPNVMDLYVMRADGSNQQQITKLPAPVLHHRFCRIANEPSSLRTASIRPRANSSFMPSVAMAELSSG